MNFDEIIDRRNTHSSKWDNMEQLYGISQDDGIAMWVAVKTPAMAPMVFAAYTVPILFSPKPLRRRENVMSGSVVPAQKAAGNMMAIASRWLPMLKIV